MLSTFKARKQVHVLLSLLMNRHVKAEKDALVQTGVVNHVRHTFAENCNKAGSDNLKVSSKDLNLASGEKESILSSHVSVSYSSFLADVLLLASLSLYHGGSLCLSTYSLSEPHPLRTANPQDVQQSFLRFEEFWGLKVPPRRPGQRATSMLSGIFNALPARASVACTSRADARGNLKLAFILRIYMASALWNESEAE